MYAHCVNGQPAVVNVSVIELDDDLRRMLRTLFKEFIHHIEDCEYEPSALNKPMQPKAQRFAHNQHLWSR